MEVLNKSYQSIKTQQKNIYNHDQGKLNKLENKIRETNESQLFYKKDMLSKLKWLEDQVILGEKSRNEQKDKINDKLRLAEEKNKEV